MNREIQDKIVDFALERHPEKAKLFAHLSPSGIARMHMQEYVNEQELIQDCQKEAGQKEAL